MVNPAFTPGQKVRLHHDCTVFEYPLKRGLAGEVFAITNQFGNPIFKVKFANGTSLPMHENELEDATLPIEDD